jgi:hypothetical protein
MSTISENELDGWQKVEFDMPLLHDLGEMYRNSILLAKGTPNEYLLSIAKGDLEFCGGREFQREGSHYGLLFSRGEVKFFLVFQVSPRRLVRLYYMGYAGEPDLEFKVLCNRFVLSFVRRFQHFYLLLDSRLRQSSDTP